LLLRIVGALTAPTSVALMCRWRSRPQHHKRTFTKSIHASSGGGEPGATLYYGARALGATGIVNFFDAHPESQRRLNKAVDFVGDLAGRFVKLFLVILCVAFVASGLAVLTINYFANH
jgi:hypothetical protein